MLGFFRNHRLLLISLGLILIGSLVAGGPVGASAAPAAGVTCSNANGSTTVAAKGVESGTTLVLVGFYRDASDLATNNTTVIDYLTSKPWRRKFTSADSAYAGTAYGVLAEWAGHSAKAYCF